MTGRHEVPKYPYNEHDKTLLDWHDQNLFVVIDKLVKYFCVVLYIQ